MIEFVDVNALMQSTSARYFDMVSNTKRLYSWLESGVERQKQIKQARKCLIYKVIPEGDLLMRMQALIYVKQLNLSMAAKDI